MVVLGELRRVSHIDKIHKIRQGQGCSTRGKSSLWIQFVRIDAVSGSCAVMVMLCSGSDMEFIFFFLSALTRSLWMGSMMMSNASSLTTTSALHRNTTYCFLLHDVFVPDLGSIRAGRAAS